MTSKQTRFCHEYVIDLNAAQAAVRAGYSRNSANRAGSHLLSKIDIQEKVADLQLAIIAKTGFEADQLFNELVKMATLDIDGTDTTAKFSDKLRALELLGRHLGFFNDKVEVKSSGPPQHVFYWPHNGREDVVGPAL